MTERERAIRIFVALDSEATRNGEASLSPAKRKAYLACIATDMTDNGGLRYFYEIRHDAEKVAQTYEAVGLLSAANAFRKSMTIFPDGIPPESDLARINWMDEHEVEVTALFDELDLQLPVLLMGNCYEVLLAYLEEQEPEINLYLRGSASVN